MNTFKTVVFLFLVAFVLTNCEQAPKSDKAKTEDAKKVDDKKSADAKKLDIDTKVSNVTWVGTKPTGKHNGTFAVKEGSISVKEGKIAGGTFTIDVASLKVLDIKETEASNAKLSGHLKSKDFFEVEKFPSATFEITSVEPYKADDTKKDEKDSEYTLKDPTHLVTGNLELKGVKKSITFPAKINLSDDKVEAEAKFNINRKDWEISYGTDESLGDKFIRPEVHIGFNIATVK